MKFHLTSKFKNFFFYVSDFDETFTVLFVEVYSVFSNELENGQDLSFKGQHVRSGVLIADAGLP